MRTKISGIAVTNLTNKKPGNGLPKFVREEAETRGYGDATETLSLFVQDGDIEEAFTCAAQGNGAACAMAQAGKRIGAKAVYFYRTTAWVDFGDGPIVRFKTSKSVYNNVIAPFDKGSREDVMPGVYHLTPPTKSQDLKNDRARAAKQKERGYEKPQSPDGGSRPVQAHTERVVMASRA